MPRLIHVTTTDMSLALLLGPQLRAFARAGYEVIGMSGVSAAGAWVAELESDGIRHVPLRHATRSVAPAHDARALAELRSAFAQLRPDIVHTHNPKPGVYGRLAARTARVPVVVNTVHGLYATPDDRWQKRAFVYALERLAASCSDAELVQNPEDLEVLARLRVPRSRLHLLGNGIDLERFDPARVPAERVAQVRADMGARPEDVVCGLVGRLVWEKGYGEVFAAAAQLRSRVPRLRVVVVGPLDPGKPDALSDLDVERARRDGGITFLGLRHDVEVLYAAMDLHVLASHREGFPRSPMEASAMGVPVVATDIRGCREAVDDGVTGRLVPVRDADALAGAIEVLAVDPELRARMGKAARLKAEQEFDQRRVIDITLSVYERLLAEHRPASRARNRLPEPSPAPLGGAVDAVVIRPATVEDAPAMARLHASEISEGFLPTLGTPFLTRLYRRVVRSYASFAFVADRDGRAVGFAAGSENLRALYRSFVLRDGLIAVAVSGRRLATSWRRVAETLRYPAHEPIDLPAAELIAIAVGREARGLGLGRRLVEAVIAEFARRGVTEARVVAGADNEPALQLYRACGFRPAVTLQVHSGVASEVMTWS